MSTTSKSKLIPKRVPARYTLHIIQSTTSDSPGPSVLVSFDSIPHKYLFGIPDSISRSFGQRQVRRVDHVFTTRIDADGGVGGLSGIIFNAIGSNVKSLKLIGPGKLLDYVTSMRLFVRKSGFEVDLKMIFASEKSRDDNGQRPQLVHSDGALKVYAFPFPNPEMNPSMSSPLSRKRRRSSSPSSQNSEKEDLDDQWSSMTFRQQNPQEFKRHLLNLQFRSDPNLATFQTRPRYAPPYIWSSFPPTPSPDSEGKRIDDCIVYLGLGPESRGRFNPKKAKEAGVTDRTLFSKLTEGGSVLSSTGRTVSWEEVMENPTGSEAFVIVDCPTLDHVPNLVDNVNIRGFLEDEYEGEIFGRKEEGRPKIKVAIHSVIPPVLEDKRYLAWMASLGSNVEHYIACKEYVPDKIQFVKSALLNLRLSKLSESMFPIQHYGIVPHSPIPPTPSVASMDKLSIQPLVPDTIIHLGPPPVSISARPLYPTFDFTVPSVEADAAAGTLKLVTASSSAQKDVLEAQHKEVLRKEQVWKEYVCTASEAREEIEKIEKDRKDYIKSSWDDVVVTTLGTGSAMPSSYRTVSSTLVQIPGHGNILLDVGEGTLGQLTRRFGHDVEKVLKDIRVIFISHLHADHHAGLYRVLWKRNQLPDIEKTPVIVLGPHNINTYLHELSHIFHLGLHKSAKFISVENPIGDGHINWLDSELGIRKLTPVKVIHPGRCFGIVIEHRDGWKLVYSGDTRPCEDLIQVGQKADLLIHEATIEDDVEDGQECRTVSYLDLAASKGHCTFGEAAEVARRMNARRCLFTHFSARYPKLPPVSSNVSQTLQGPSFGISFDLMSIRMGDWWKLEHFRKAMETLFKEIEPDEVQETSMEDSGAQVVVMDGSTATDTREKDNRKKDEKSQSKKPQKKRVKQAHSASGRNSVPKDSLVIQT